MKQELEAAVVTTVQEVFNLKAEVTLTRPDEQFGDYATNVALQLSKQLGKNPREFAAQLKAALAERLSDDVLEISVAGPGFLNIKVSDQRLLGALKSSQHKPLAGQTVVAEYSDPNPFKVLHAGHLYTSVVGDSISNLLENAGAIVHRVNFGGDVGLHVAKNMWAIINHLGGEYPKKLAAITKDVHAQFLGDCYVRGNEAYESGVHKEDIMTLNKRVYLVHSEKDHESPFAQIYWTCRQWSYDYFEEFYARIGSTFEKYYPESQTTPIGLEAVKTHPEVFVSSEGAVIFDGEPFGLHKRVFITSQGLPTYETKDMGATLMKFRDYRFDESVIITGNDIVEYMKVVLKATEQFEPKIAQSTRHLTHGNVKLAGGVKMSSRLGNVLRATDVLDAAAEANKELTGNTSEPTSLGAVKYAFLKQRMGGGDIIYDPKESVSVEGNSGPYLQYAHARAKSILRKSSNTFTLDTANLPDKLEAGERSLALKISEYPEIVAKATSELMPHYICTYLYELAQTFNRFYEHNRVIGDKRQGLRLALVDTYAETLNSGLGLLGISAPDKM